MSASQSEPAHFGYGPDDGPAKWASLDPAYADCETGRAQSPIDLKGGVPAALPNIAFDYKPSKIELENNGHSVQANYEPGSAIVIDGTTLELAQFHYHAPSEHTVEGKGFPLEFHFVYKDPDGRATVIGVFAKEGAENPAFAPLIDALPELKADGDSAALDGGLNPAELMPKGVGSAARWSYVGSLTTPPCSEGIGWNVVEEPVELSAAQIASFTDLYDNTNRPVQPLNGRELLVSR